jgi:hypothetical protein
MELVRASTAEPRAGGAVLLWGMRIPVRSFDRLEQHVYGEHLGTQVAQPDDEEGLGHETRGLSRLSLVCFPSTGE